MRIQLVGAACALAATALVAGLVAQPAQATVQGRSTTPASASLTVTTSKINAGSRPSFTYTSAHLPAGSKLYLQRQFGFKHVWKTVVNLPARSGATTAPSVGLGLYYYRVQAVHNSTQVAASNGKRVYSYGKVSIGRLCSHYQGYSCDSGTTQVGGTIFSWSAELGSSYYPSFNQAIKYGQTSCRSISLTFSGDQYDQDNNDGRSYVKIVQGASDPVQSSVGVGHIGSISTALDGGPFYLDVSQADDDNVDLAGNASCWSANGAR